jgi:hypothetical protein
VLLIRNRLHDIFPDVEVPSEYIGWHLRQSISVDTICSNLVSEILSSGQVNDPTSNQPVNSTINIDETLQTLFDVFNHVPRVHVQNTYNRLKNNSSTAWYDELVNELLAYDVLDKSSSTSKRPVDDDTDQLLSNGYERILAILPDIDPDYAQQCYVSFLETFTTYQKDYNVFISNLIESGYTKITDKIATARHRQLKENLTKYAFNIEEFLKTFPNPLVYFYDQTKNVSESYRTHAYIYLANAFARISSVHIRKVLEYNNYRFPSAIKQLQEEFSTYHVNTRKKSNHGKQQYRMNTSP